jgi:hypothetical protein
MPAQNKTARDHARSRADKTRAYFAGFAFAGICTLSTCSSIWVPESSFTFSVFDTITEPGVLALGVVLRLKPFNPKTPWGMPILIGLPFEATSSRAPALSTCVEGDCLTVMGAWYVVSDAPAAPPPLPRVEVDELAPRPLEVVGASRDIPPPTIEGGSI